MYTSELLLTIFLSKLIVPVIIFFKTYWIPISLITLMYYVLKMMVDSFRQPIYHNTRIYPYGPPVRKFYSGGLMPECHQPYYARYPRR